MTSMFFVNVLCFFLLFNNTDLNMYLSLNMLLVLFSFYFQ